MSNVWIFQANPAKYDLPTMIQPGKKDDWGVSRHRAKIGDGDTVIIWQSGDEAGIVGFGKIVGKLGKRADGDCIDIEITERLDPPLPKADLERDPVLCKFPVIPLNFQANPFDVPADHWDALQKLRADALT